MAEVLHAEIHAEATGGETLERVRRETHALRQEITKLHQDERHAVGFGSRLAETMALVSERTEGLREHLFEARNALGETRNMGGELLPTLGALGAAMSVTGFVEMARETAEARTQLNAMAETLGLSVSQLQAYRLASQEADVPIEDMQGSILKLDRAMAQAASGKSKDAAAIFGRMGISLRDAHGQLKSVMDVLPLVAQSLSKTHDETLRNAVAMTLFGRSGAYLIPFLKVASENMDELRKRSDQLNASLSPEDNENIERFKNSWIELDTAVGGLKDTITADLSPVLTPVLHDITDWIAANRTGIGSTITSDFKALSVAVHSINWQRLETDTGAVARVLNEGAKHLGGWTTILEVMAGFSAFKFALDATKPVREMGRIGIEAFKLAATLDRTICSAWDRIEERAVAAGEKEEAAASIPVRSGGVGRAASGARDAIEGAAAVGGASAVEASRRAARDAARGASRRLGGRLLRSLPVVGEGLMIADSAIEDLPPIVRYLASGLGDLDGDRPAAPTVAQQVSERMRRTSRAPVDLPDPFDPTNGGPIGWEDMRRGLPGWPSTRRQRKRAS